MHHSMLSESGDNGNFYIDEFGQFGYLHRFAGRCEFGLEIFAVYSVDTPELVHVFYKHRGFQYLFEAGTGCFEDGTEVLQHAVRFFFDTAEHELARWRVDSDLTGNEQQAVKGHGLVVGPDRRRGVGCVDDLFHGNWYVSPCSIADVKTPCLRGEMTLNRKSPTISQPYGNGTGASSKIAAEKV